MKKPLSDQFEVDNSSILYLALMRKKHTNIYRFTVSLTEEICPDTLQKAVNRVCRRFPTIFAGFLPGFFRFTQVATPEPPRVSHDPGCLITMSAEEIRTCAYRVYYSGRDIIIEAFHAAADGYGAIATFTTLTAEYLRLKHGIQIPDEFPIRSLEESPADFELEDSYLRNCGEKPLHLPSRYSFQLSGEHSGKNTVSCYNYNFPTGQILSASRRIGVTATALFSGVMAASIMEIQRKSGAKALPVRIMVPVDLRRIFPSKTLRNFILYVLPTMEPEDHCKPLPELMADFQCQIRKQAEPERLASIIAYNVKTQNSPLFRLIPRRIKCAAMRLAYRFFGESNSSITLTNLGAVKLPDQMLPFVDRIHMVLTPRARSPYNCGVISYGDQMILTLSTSCAAPDLPEIFERKINGIISDFAE